mgnify:CR=1 FL=1
MLVDGIIFGLIDNIVLIGGAYTGLSVENKMFKNSTGLGAIVGGGFGNAVSDCLAGLPMSITFGVATAIGCPVSYTHLTLPTIYSV